MQDTVKRLSLPAAFGALLLFLVMPGADSPAGMPGPEGKVGMVIYPESSSWTDDSSGYEITQWTKTGNNHHPYFTVDSFIDEQTAIIFSDRTGNEQLYKLDLQSGAMTQMTQARQLRNLEHLPAMQRAWYFDGTLLRELDTRTLTSADVFDFGETYDVQSFSVTCDGRWFVFAAGLAPRQSTDGHYGPFAVYKLDLRSKAITRITPEYGFRIGHVQANPVDPNLILYCWQWDAPGRKALVGDTPLRIWWVNIEGTDGGPLAQPFGLHRTHEAWSPDGRNVTYSGDFRFGPSAGREVLGIQSLDGTVNTMYDASVWHAHQQMFRDNRHWAADLLSHDDRVLVMFTRAEDKMEKTEVLFRHGSSWTGQSSHPHMRFSPNGTYILFSTDKTGSPQVYTVRVNLSSPK